MLAPAMILFVFLLLHGAWLFRLAVRRQYIVIDGICTYIQRTAVRKRAKYLQLDVQGMRTNHVQRSHVPYHSQQWLRLYLTPANARIRKGRRAASFRLSGHRSNPYDSRELTVVFSPCYTNTKVPYMAKVT